MTEHETVGTFVDQREARAGEHSDEDLRRGLVDLDLTRAGW